MWARFHAIFYRTTWSQMVWDDIGGRGYEKLWAVYVKTRKFKLNVKKSISVFEFHKKNEEEEIGFQKVLKIDFFLNFKNKKILL